MNNLRNNIKTNFTSQELFMYLVKYRQIEWELPLLFKPINFFIKCVNNNIDYSMYTFYGSPQFEWNAGRKGENISISDAILSLDKLSKFNIPHYFTFTNYNLSKEGLKNTFGNTLLQYIDTKNRALEYNKRHGVIISSDLLYSYIKHNFPNIKTKCSILKSSLEYKSKDIEWYIKMLDLYDDVILHVDFKIDDLHLFDKSVRHRLEVLVNEKCVKNCKFRASYCYLQNDITNHPKCIARNKNIINTVLTSEEIEYITSLGITKLKLQGRTEIKI